MKPKLNASLPAPVACAKSPKYMLYTRKGDGGTTKLFTTPQGVRIGKDSKIFEALGTVDELNASLGYAKALCRNEQLTVLIGLQRMPYEKVLTELQNTLFTIQAEIAGSDMHPTVHTIEYVENIIFQIETLLPPVQSFVVPGGTLAASYLDICRTIARRAERLLVTVSLGKYCEVSPETLQFMNRLSSVLYALARFGNYTGGISEDPPHYHT